MKTIHCTANIYQNGEQVALMAKGNLKVRIAPLVYAHLPQPNNDIIEVSGAITTSLNFNANAIMTIAFVTEDGHHLIGDFYLNPYKTGDRVCFELSGALTIVK